MGKTAIQWTASDDGTPGYTWNAIVGCDYVSAGCTFCYAATLHNRRYIAWKRGNFPTAPAQYHQPFKRVQLMPERLEAPLHWRKSRRVFVNSVSDLFHADVPDDYIAQMFAVMLRTPQHTYQVLTKRPERMLTWRRDFWPVWSRDLPAQYLGTRLDLPNVWLGVSTENQATADERIPLLLETPAAVRFISAEPLLGPIDLRHLHYEDMVEVDALAGTHGVFRPHGGVNPGLSWVIVGGESGAHARPMTLDWARSLRDDCVATNTPYFFKQVGGRTPKAGGRELDGREWNQYPDTKGTSPDGE